MRERPFQHGAQGAHVEARAVVRPDVGRMDLAEAAGRAEGVFGVHGGRETGPFGPWVGFYRGCGGIGDADGDELQDGFRVEDRDAVGVGCFADEE